MLEEMRIQGLGVIDDATVQLDRGLTVVTGETGAGKTMIVTGLSLLFGGRADTGRIRPDADRAWVEGRLRLPPESAALRRALDAGAELDEDGTMLISRSISAEGRSRAHLGGRSVPLGVLAELAGDVLAVHGQSDQTRLRRPAEQRAALDRYAGAGLAGLRAEYAAAFGDWQRHVADIAERTAHGRERAQEAEVLRHGLGVIEAADPHPGEAEALAAEINRLSFADELGQGARAAHEALAGESGDDRADVSGLLGAARRALAPVIQHDEQLAELDARLAEIGYLVADTGAELASYAESVDSDPLRLEQALTRRATVQGLLRTYADTVEEVLAWAARAGLRLLQLDNSDDALAELAERRDAACDVAAELAGRLSAARRETAARFGAAVSAELTGLAMPDAVVDAHITTRPAAEAGPVLVVDGIPAGAGPDGIDEVELRLAAHPGAPLQALQRGASGGELSRVMLAVEVVFVDTDPVPVMVFDEVDAGVGGRAATEVGRRLARLARDHQVLVVTHLPQVAAYADTHLVIGKSTRGPSTRSTVRSLPPADRAGELARMLAGLEGSEHAHAHAAELLTMAALDKRASTVTRA